MEIAITGEGKTDYGILVYETNTWKWKWGPIAAYIQKIADKNSVPVTLHPITRKDITELRLQRSMDYGR